MNDEQILNDMLIWENECAKAYCFSLLPCTSTAVHDGLLTILTEQHQICFDIKSELGKRGLLNIN